MAFNWPSIRREWAKVVQADPQIPPPRLTQPAGPPEPTASDLARCEAEIEQQAKRQAR